MRVKGKLEPVSIYEPVGPLSEIDSATRADLEKWEEALGAYNAQDWDNAERRLRELRTRDERPLYQLYLERVAQFRAAPPPADWDGVYTYTTK